MAKNRNMLAELEAVGNGRPVRQAPVAPVTAQELPAARPAATAAPEQLQPPVRRNRATRNGTGSSNPSRKGLVNVTGYFPPAVKQSIRLIQAQSPDRRTEQAILAEALNDVFAKYKVPQIALTEFDDRE